jgi:hypothetical protein
MYNHVVTGLSEKRMEEQRESRKRRGAKRLAPEERRTDQFVCRLFRRDRLIFDLLVEVDRSQTSMTGIVLHSVREYAKGLGIDWDNPDPELVRRYLRPEVAEELLVLAPPKKSGS